MMLPLSMTHSQSETSHTSSDSKVLGEWAALAFPSEGRAGRLVRRYARMFSLQEISQSSVLQWFWGAMLFVFFITFDGWFHDSTITQEARQSTDYVCWPYFQDCEQLYVFQALPEGYSQPILYAVLLGCIVAAAFFLIRREWFFAHLFTSVLFSWKAFVMFVMTMSYSGNFDYYHIVLTGILLFLPLKLFFLKIVFVFFYFLAATIKLHETWILGTYFSALKTGLPIFPESITPLITNLVIGMQIVGVWLLLSKHRWLQIPALSYFTTFHLYSTILVGFRYPGTVLPALLILFGDHSSRARQRDFFATGIQWRALPGWCLVACMVVLQLSSVFIPGDERYTLEGNKLGLYMFEANHQCIGKATIHLEDGSTHKKEVGSSLARDRCEPYDAWFRLNELCQHSENIARIEWTFDHAINGGPFYRIVDTDNACELEYHMLQHNDWIQTPEEGAEKVGDALENHYR